MGGLSIWHWLIVLAIILLVFGTKKLRNMGPDIGAAIREFKNALGGDDTKDEDKNKQQDASASTLHDERGDPEPTETRKREHRDRTD